MNVLGFFSPVGMALKGAALILVAQAMLMIIDSSLSFGFALPESALNTVILSIPCWLVGELLCRKALLRWESDLTVLANQHVALAIASQTIRAK